MLQSVVDGWLADWLAGPHPLLAENKESCWRIGENGTGGTSAIANLEERDLNAPNN